jgi:hypothetical protein
VHWNGKAWTKVPVPKGLNPGSLASDGHGGAWMTSNAIYHYSGGRWTHVPLPAKSGFATMLRRDLGSDLELVPGTRSVLAGVQLVPAGFNVEGAILKYGP